MTIIFGARGAFIKIMVSIRALRGIVDGMGPVDGDKSRAEALRGFARVVFAGEIVTSMFHGVECF